MTPDESIDGRVLVGPVVERIARGRFAEAYQACEEVAQQAPEYPPGRILRSRLLELVGRPADAWSELRSLLGLSPDAAVLARDEFEFLSSSTGVPLTEEKAVAAALLETARRRVEDAGEALPSVTEDDAPWLEPDPPSEPLGMLELPWPLPRVHVEARDLVDARFGRIIHEFCSPDAERALVILCHEPHAVDEQRNLYLQLEQILVRVPSVPVLVEGWASDGVRTGGPLSRRGLKTAAALEELANEATLATDVLARLYRGAGIVHGAEDPELIAAQEEARLRIERSLASGEATPSFIEDALSAWSDLLVGAADQARGPKMARFEALVDEGIQAGKLESIVAFEPLAREAGVDLERYPTIAAGLEAFSLEERIDFGEAEQGRQQVVQALAELSLRELPEMVEEDLAAWVRAGSPTEFELERAYAHILEAAGLTPTEQPEPKRGLLGRVLRSPAGDDEAEESRDLADRWLARVVVLSAAHTDARISQGYYYGRLESLINVLGIQLEPTFRQYFRYIALAARIERDREALAAVELRSLGHELARGLASTGTEFGVRWLQRELADTRRMVRLKLPAERVRSVLGARRSFGEWLGDAEGLVVFTSALAAGPTPEWSIPRWIMQRVASTLDGALHAVREYYEIALQRSECMVRSSLDGDLAAFPVRVLVCGRFHVHEAARLSRLTPGLSIVVASPFPEPEYADAGGRTYWSVWDEEAAAPDS